VCQPGELKVVAYKNGKQWVEDVRKTTGVAAKLELVADRCEIVADGSDLSFITVRVLDHEAFEVPRSHNRVQFRIDGPGEIIAVGNGDPTSHEPFQALERKVFNGMALVVVRSEEGRAGRIKLSASSKGLQGAQCELKTVAVGE
jgi:beta-galactosidase